jgi:hypothetical protein
MTTGTDKSVQDGGAFITVRLNAKMAEFDFWAAGGRTYPFSNSAPTDNFAPQPKLLPAKKQHLLYYDLPKDLKIEELKRQKFATLKITARGLK